MRTACRALAAAALAVCAVLAAGAPAPAVPAAGGDPWLLYVADAGSDSVSVIDTARKAVVAVIPVGDAPGRVAISPDSTTAYVTNEGDGTVSVIDTFTNAVADTTTTTTAGATAGPVTAVTTPDGGTRYAVNPARNWVDVIDTATAAVVATISGGGAAPCGVAISPDGTIVYVANESGTVSLIDTASNSVLDMLAIGGRPCGVAITPDQAPRAVLAVTPAPTGQPTTLDASESTLRFGTVATYTWDFGDGSVATTTVPSTIHTYAAPGRYLATVTLTSSGGTSTARVSSGQTVIRNGGPQARATRAVTVSGYAGEGGGLPITGRTARPAVLVGALATALGAVLVLLCQPVDHRGRRGVPARRRYHGRHATD